MLILILHFPIPFFFWNTKVTHILAFRTFSSIFIIMGNMLVLKDEEAKNYTTL